MIAHKVENNPVYREQVRKRKGLLCAAFAAAACSAGVLFAVARDDHNKVMTATMVTTFAAYASWSQARREKMKSDEAMAKASYEEYGPAHPHQLLVTDVLRGHRIHEGAKVYRIQHKGMQSIAFSDLKDVYIDSEYERLVGDEHVRAIVAHEAGHLQDDPRLRSFARLNFYLAGAAGYSVPIMLMFSPPSWPVMAASLAGVGAAFMATNMILLTAGRHTEHICDIRAMYNTGSKTAVQESVFASFHVNNQILSADHKKESDEMKAKGEGTMLPLELPGDDYPSRFNTHPNPQERKVVMDAAAKYMP